MIFRQLFEPVSFTYTYLLGCTETRQAVMIDPVMPAWQRDLKVVNELGLKLVMTIDTHIVLNLPVGRRARKRVNSAGWQTRKPRLLLRGAARSSSAGVAPEALAVQPGSAPTKPPVTRDDSEASG